MVEIKKGSKYFEVNLFDALFSTSKGKGRQKSFIKRMTHGSKKDGFDSNKEPDKSSGKGPDKGPDKEPKKEPNKQPNKEPNKVGNGGPAPTAAAPVKIPTIVVTGVGPDDLKGAQILGEVSPAIPKIQAPVESADAGRTMKSAAIQTEVKGGFPKSGGSGGFGGYGGFGAFAGFESGPIMPQTAFPAAPFQPFASNAPVKVSTAPPDGVSPGGTKALGPTEMAVLCNLKAQKKPWMDIALALNTDVETCINEYMQIPASKKVNHPVNTTAWSETEMGKVGSLKDEAGKSFAFIAAALLRPEGEIKSKYNEFKKSKAKGKQDGAKPVGKKPETTEAKNGKQTEANVVGKPGAKAGEIKNNEAVSVAMVVPELHGDQAPKTVKVAKDEGEDAVSLYDPSPPDYRRIHQTVERYDDGRPLRDHNGRLVDETDVDYLRKLAYYYDNQKWVDVGKRFFDETGRRLQWDEIKNKFGNLRFP